jgi:hypothetical protein
MGHEARPEVLAGDGDEGPGVSEPEIAISVEDALTLYLGGFTQFNEERCRRGAQGVLSIIEGIRRLNEDYNDLEKGST